MDKKKVRQKIEEGFREKKWQIEIEGITLHLLPYGHSFKLEEKDNELVIYNDLYLKKPNFFVFELQRKLGRTNKIDSARTEVREIPKDVFEEFCKLNHFKKGTNSKLRYGLFINDHLILVAGFSKPKKTYKNDEKVFRAELYRVVYGGGIEAPTGLSKVINYFVQTHNISELTAFVANEYEYNNDYLESGFEVIEKYEPEYQWLHTETNERFSTGQLLKKGVLRRDSLEEMVHPPKGYLPIKNKGGKLLVINR